MRKMLVILLFLVGATALGRVDIAPCAGGVESNISDLHHEQLCCSHRYYVDAERTSSIVVPSVRTTTTSVRHSHQRTIALIPVEHHQSTTRYSVARYLHRLGSSSRAVDYYLHMLCVLRL